MSDKICSVATGVAIYSRCRLNTFCTGQQTTINGQVVARCRQAREVLQPNICCKAGGHEKCCNGGLGGVAMKVKGHSCNTAGWVLLQWQTDRAQEMHINGRLLQWQKDCVAMVDGMLQDAGGCRVAILASEWTTVNSATPKYSSYRMCCNKPTGTGGTICMITLL